MIKMTLGKEEDNFAKGENAGSTSELGTFSYTPPAQ